MNIPVDAPQPFTREQWDALNHASLLHEALARTRTAAKIRRTVYHCPHPTSSESTPLQPETNRP